MQIYFYLFLIILVIVFSIIFYYTVSLSKKKEEKLPYTDRWAFMTPSELAFYQQLEITVGEKYYIVPQVQLSKILYVSKGNREYYKYQNKIDRKTLDFVLFTKPDFKFFKAIELDDFTHDREDRKRRDIFVDEAMKIAGLDLIHVDHRESFKI